LGKSSWNGDLIGGFNPSQNVCVIQGIVIPNIVDNSNILFQRFETTPKKMITRVVLVAAASLVHPDLGGLKPLKKNYHGLG